jgi:hypothetical protein
MTAIGWRAAWAGLTGSPVSADGTVSGLGLGLGLGVGDGDGVAPIVGLAALEGDADGLAVATVLKDGTGVVGEQPIRRTAAAIASPASKFWRSRPITRRRIADVWNHSLRLARGCPPARTRCGFGPKGGKGGYAWDPRSEKRT